MKKNGLSNSRRTQIKAKTVVLLKKIKQNLQQQDTCRNVSGNSVMGSIAETHRIEVCVLGEGRKKEKRNPTQSKKPLTCTATQCSSYYGFLPKYACIIKPPNSSLCKRKTNLIKLSVWQGTHDSLRWHRRQSHTDLLKTKLCKVLESDAVERS